MRSAAEEAPGERRRRRLVSLAEECRRRLPVGAGVAVRRAAREEARVGRGAGRGGLLQP